VSTPSIEPVEATLFNGACRRAFIILFLLIAGKAVLLLGIGQPSLETDMVAYWKMGSHFAQGDWLQRDIPNGSQWPPGYPLFLGAVQASFGKYALAATTALQIFLDFVNALLTAHICAKVTGSRAGALIGLTLSFFCLSRSCFAVYAMADNLFCTTIILYFLSLLSWLKRPTLWTAAAVGATLAFAVLVKSVAQPLCLSTLALMGYKFWRSKCLYRIWPHVVIIIAVIATMLTPWIIRNKIVYGHYVLLQFTGRALWDTCRVNPNQLPVNNADGPSNRKLRSLLDGTGVDMDSSGSTAPITVALLKKGYSDYDIDKMMQAATLESIAEHPIQYLAGRPLRFAWFWATPKPFFNVPWGTFYAARELPSGRFASVQETAVPEGQVTWELPRWRATGEMFYRVAWHPNSFVFALAALASALGCVYMIRSPGLHESGLATASVLLAVSLTTTCFGWPQYRFRLPLEPIMIVAVAPALLSLWHCCSGRELCPRGYNRNAAQR
jgi:hypothetical protein